jgi:hypothetical protein
VGLTLLAGSLAALAAVARSRAKSSERATSLYSIALACIALAAVVAVAVYYGGPVKTVQRAWSSFTTPLPQTQPDLRKRLFSFSGNHRYELYKAAWSDAKAHPLIGSGAGSYEEYWVQHRPAALIVRDAHSLYLEKLAELGIVGLVLLLIGFGAPLRALLMGRRRMEAAAALGAYVGYLVGSGVDWQWELTAVTVPAVLIGGYLLVVARTEEREMTRSTQTVILVGAGVVACAALVFLVGNMFLSRGQSAADSGNWTAAARDARHASDWLPWSTSPLTALGEAQLASGETGAARRTFKAAIAKDERNWSLWLDLARASVGAPQRAALARATTLNPLSPEIRQFRSELGGGGGGGLDVSAGGG